MLSIAFLVFAVLGVFATAILAVKGVNWRLFAGGNKAKVVFRSTKGTASPGDTFETFVLVDPTGSQLIFSHMEIAFDPATLKLKSVSEPNNLTRVIKTSSVSDANRAGKVTLAYALEPGSAPPQGAFDLVVLKFEVLGTAVPGSSTSISLLGENVELVELSGKVFEVAYTPSDISIGGSGDAPAPPDVPEATPTSDDDDDDDDESEVGPGQAQVSIENVGQVGGMSYEGKVSEVKTESKVRAGEDLLYVAVVSTKPNRVVKKMEGLNLNWTKAGEQCGGRGVTRTEVWWAYGSPSEDGYVGAELDSKKLKAVVISVLSYRGTNPNNPIGKVVTRNSNGVSDTKCRRGRDSETYSLGIDLTASGMILSAVSTRHYTHTPLNGFTEIVEIKTTRGGGEDAGVAVMQKAVEPGHYEAAGVFQKSSDYAVVVIELLGL